MLQIKIIVQKIRFIETCQFLHRTITVEDIKQVKILQQFKSNSCSSYLTPNKIYSFYEMIYKYINCFLCIIRLILK
jgi:hypothetical protein